MTELKIALTEKQKAFLHAVEKFPVTFYGGAKGGGKSHGLRNIILLRRFQHPGSIGAIFRKSFPELEGNHIGPIFRQFPELRRYYNESKKILFLPNGSSLEFCYCENDKDLDRYQGREFHDLGIEEAGQWTEAAIQRLRGSNRSSNPNIKPRTLLTGNPGGPGHAYLKRVFVEKRFKPEEVPSDYAFIQALVDDNPALMENDPDYVRRLEAEPNLALRKAFRWGDWDIFAGQFFSEIRREVHVVKDFEIPHHWNRFGAYDFGFNHPASFGWFACDSDGNVYLYRVFNKPRLRIDQQCAELLRFKDTEDLYPVVAGHDCWTKKGIINDKTPPTIAEEFQKHGIRLQKAVIDRVQGATQLRNYLAWQDKPNEEVKPKFYIFESCMQAFDCLARMLHDPDHLEDVLKVDAVDGDPDTGDDIYDMIRYGLMSRPAITDPLKPNHPWGSKEWAKEQVDQMEEQAVEHFTELERQQNPWEYGG